MKITETRTNLVNFKEVDIGQVFKFDDRIYLCTFCNNDGDNAVDLSTGYLDSFVDSTKVDLLDAELVIH